MANRRDAQFKSALRRAGISRSQWCRDAGITRTHLARVLDNPKQSAPLIAKVRAFIKANPPRQPEAIAS